VIETRRADDFSPVKNADGLDSPQTCRDDQLRQFARWLRANGAAVTTDASGLARTRSRCRRFLVTTRIRSPRRGGACNCH
jgi:hypothetical protein